MNRTKKIILAIKNLIRQPSLINQLLNQDQHWHAYLQKKHKNLTVLPVVELQAITQQEQANLESIAFLDGSSLPTDLFLLQSLASSFKNCQYFEIGTWRGESAINVAKVAAVCHTLNLSKEEILANGWGEDYANLHGFFSKESPKIKQWYGNSKDFDFSKPKQKFDLIFIDGSHKYEFVKNDTQQVFAHLVHDSSIVVWHDYAYNPEQLRPEVLAGILDGMPKKFHSNLYHASNTKCAVMIKKQLATKVLKKPSKPSKSFSIHMKIKPLN